MAAPKRNVPAALRAILETEGHRFGFFQAVALAERLAPSAARPGELGPVYEEAVRLRHEPSLIFHAGDVAGVRFTAEGRVEIASTFLGLTGSASPLATYFTEDVLRAQDRDEHALGAFYDLFHHRLLGLFYRAWKKYRFATAYRPDGSDDFSRRALALVGVDAKRPGASLPAHLRLALAPLLASRVRSPRTLQRVLQRVLPDASVAVEPFVERSVRLAEAQRAQLGIANTTLGDSLTLGRNVVDRSARFRVSVGPVGLDAFLGLLPGGRAHTRVSDVILELTPGALEPELEVVLASVEAPRLQLGQGAGARLGVTTQLVGATPLGLRARVVLGDKAAPLRVALAEPPGMTAEDGRSLLPLPLLSSRAPPPSGTGEVRAPSAPPPASEDTVDLSAVEAFANLPPDMHVGVARAATLVRLRSGDALTDFGLAFVVRGEVLASSADEAAAGARLGAGGMLRVRAEAGDLPITLYPATPLAVVAAWSRAQLDELFTTCPWVDDDLLAASERAHALVGASAGVLGLRLDLPQRERLFARLAVRALGPGETLAAHGQPMRAFTVVGSGAVEGHGEGAGLALYGPGSLVHPSFVLSGAPLPVTVRAGRDGATVLQADRAVLRTLAAELPPLAALVAGG